MDWRSCVRLVCVVRTGSGRAPAPARGRGHGDRGLLDGERRVGRDGHGRCGLEGLAGLRGERAEVDGVELAGLVVDRGGRRGAAAPIIETMRPEDAATTAVRRPTLDIWSDAAWAMVLSGVMGRRAARWRARVVLTVTVALLDACEVSCRVRVEESPGLADRSPSGFTPRALSPAPGSGSPSLSSGRRASRGDRVRRSARGLRQMGIPTEQDDRTGALGKSHVPITTERRSPHHRRSRRSGR